MKRILLVTAIAAAILSSCSKNEVVTSNLDNQALSFGIYTGTTTKSGEVTTNSLAARGFGVFGYYKAYSDTDLEFATTDKPNFMYNQAVYGYDNTPTIITDPTNTTAPTSWDYTPQKYWPNNTKDILTFFAYGPHSTNKTGTDCITFNPVTAGSGSAKYGSDGNTAMVGIPTIKYELLDGNTADLVAAPPVYGSKNESAYNEENTTVSFEFEHLLTRVKFSAYLDVTDFNAINNAGTAFGSSVTDNGVTVNDAETKVYVTKLVILGNSDATSKYVDKDGATVTSKSTGLYSSNTFTYLTPTEVKAKANTHDVDGVGSWSSSPIANTDDYDLGSLLNTTTTPFVDYTPGTSSNSAGNVSNPGVDVTATTVAGATPLFKKEDTATDTQQDYLFLLPVTDGLKASTSEMYVYIEYDVVTLDGELKLKYSSITNKDVIKLPDGGLKLGTAYNYILTIGLDEVTVEAEVDDWTEGEYYAATPE